MDKQKYIKSDTEYLDLAKSITDYLYDVSSDKSKEYTISTVLAATSIGVYMFLREIAVSLRENENFKDIEAIDLYEDFDSWVKWADSKFKKES